MNDPPKEKTAPVGPIKNEVEEPRGQKSGLRREVKKMTRSKHVEQSTTVHCERTDTLSDMPTPVALALLDGKLNGILVRVLKDDVCSTNVISLRLLVHRRSHFQLKKFNTVVQQSREGSAEKSSQVFIIETLKIKTHLYTSSWVVEDCR